MIAVRRLLGCAVALVASLALAASARSQCVNIAQADGTADALTVPTLPCTVTSSLLVLTVQSTNTTRTPTISVNGQPAQTIVAQDGSALAVGALQAGGRYQLTYNGTKWFLLNSNVNRSVLNLGNFKTPEDYNGSGSSQTTTGSITAGESVITLASSIDFTTSQGILICGAGIAQTGATPSGLVVAQHGAAGATTYAYRISTDDGNGGLSAALGAVQIANGNATLSTSNYNSLSWVAGAGAVRYHIWVSKSGGAYTYIGSTALTTYNDTGTIYNAPFWVPSTPNAAAQADFMVSAITLIAGSSGRVTLSGTATTTATSKCVQHDDTVAVQAAVTAAIGSFNYFSPSGNPWANYQIPAVQLADGGRYNISSAITTNVSSLALFSRSNATVVKAGFNGNSISSSTLARLAVENVTFGGGAHSLSIGNSNVDDSLYWLNHVEFQGTTDYAIQTTGDYSAHLQCYACNFAGVNGAIASDADVVTVHAGWSSTHFLWFQLNRAWFKQTHTSYYNAIWNIDDHVGVPYQSDGIAYVQGNRWIDVQGTAHLYGNRWGGEQAGIPVAYIQSTISTATTPQIYQGPAIDIRGGWAFCGPTSGMSVIGCVVMNGIPISVSFDSTGGPSTVPLVTDNIGGGFATAVANWKSGSGQTDATPFIEFSLKKGAARSASWPPPGSLWPTSVNPYIRDYHASGTWTPSLQGSTIAGAPTYTVRTGFWEQNNATVTVPFFITTTGLGGPTGNIQIAGLPVPMSNTANERGSCVITDQNGVTLDAGFTQLTALIEPNTSVIRLWEFQSAGGSGAATPVSDYAAATRLSGSCTYLAW